jgi:hypothetical protein
VANITESFGSLSQTCMVVKNSSFCPNKAKISPSREPHPSTTGHPSMSMGLDSLALVSSNNAEKSRDVLGPNRKETDSTLREKKDLQAAGLGLSREAAEALVKKLEQKLVAREAETSEILRFAHSLWRCPRRLDRNVDALHAIRNVRHHAS